MQRLRQAARYLKYRFASRALILMYHRVTELANDPYLLAVSPKHFAEQMEVIRGRYMPIRLQELVETLQDGKVPNRAVVVTFDDGYADNLHQAKPLLEHYEIPATVFVTTGHIDSQREFWWDELDRILLQPGTLPGRLCLSFNGSAYEWDLGEVTRYTAEEYRRYRTWHIERQDDPSQRQRLFRMLYARLSTLPGGERLKILNDLLAWSGAKPIARPSHQTLTTDEVILLDQGDLLEVGAHTMTHPFLAGLSPAEQRNEIQQSKEGLEAILMHLVLSFAYPHGSSTPHSAVILQEKGFICACSSHHAVVQGFDCFQLPRVVVRDWDGQTFARWLRGWVCG
jgi:peptidoglycan/xylan/chitin deacetylase (PgdA/CDA1 family)